MLDEPPVGPRHDPTMPRYAGFATFALLPRIEDVGHADIALLGVPFDSGTSFRPGARFGPNHIREHSRQLHPYHQVHHAYPFSTLQVVDAGDVGAGPFDIAQAVAAIETHARALVDDGTRIVALGGDHTIALPLLRAAAQAHGPVAVLHFDAHLDTWDTLHGASVWHGSPFRRASEEGLIDLSRSQHVGIRGGIYGPSEIVDDRRLGFELLHCDEFERRSVADIVGQVRARLGDGPVYVSVDIDVLDPAHAPGTGTPEVAGLTTRELFCTLRGIRGLDIVGCDVVEVAPAYDHAGITGLAAAHTAWELITLMGLREAPRPLPPDLATGAASSPDRTPR